VVPIRNYEIRVTEQYLEVWFLKLVWKYSFENVETFIR